MNRKERTLGPSISIGRQFHSCSIVSFGSLSKVVVIGGRNLKILDSVEIFDIKTNKWYMGQAFPTKIYMASILQHKFGKSILIGGHNGSKAMKSLFLIELNQNNVTYQEMASQLDFPRWSMLTIFLPDDYFVEH